MREMDINIHNSATEGRNSKMYAINCAYITVCFYLTQVSNGATGVTKLRGPEG